MYNKELFFYIPLILFTIFLFFWIIFKIFRIHRPGLPALLSIIISTIITFLFFAYFHPIRITIPIIPFVLGYLIGRSTSMHRDPINMFSPIEKLDPLDYNDRVEYFIEWFYDEMMSGRIIDFFKSPSIPRFYKFNLLYQKVKFDLYRISPVLSLIISCFYLTIYSTSVSSIIPIFILAFPFGFVMGELVKYVKGNKI
jgi:hypothetical protein